MNPRSVLRLESVCPWLEEHGFHVADRGLLAAALERPWLTFEETDLYPGPWLKAAALMDSIISTHPFVDGNKRSGVLLTVLLLRAYDIPVEGTSSDDWFELAVSTATASPSVEEIAARLQAMVEEH
ncbi:type II toxin-antitoxin system death-on-curing family toxin [Corynebacterium urinipleomorphum]|uniref:type II toxin-antitoxin system death-on-curing family toxin n=1 Tax=Corynebacterium urinipleomorphum TaxID=1852380 RepID=UPI000B360CF6|nr:Fic family protein [Corynebacterium urinipleomorphum]